MKGEVKELLMNAIPVAIAMMLIILVHTYWSEQITNWPMLSCLGWMVSLIFFIEAKGRK